MNRNDTIYVAGHRGLVGSAILRELKWRGYDRISTKTSSELDLRDPVAVKWWFSCVRPKYVFLAAARVGGIKANADDQLGFFLDNMAIETNVIKNAAECGTEKLLFLGSSCIYPKLCPQPIREEYLLTGPIEPTTEAYALAKICGIRLCQWYRRQHGKNFVSAMPCNIYGLGDSMDEHRAHVIPGMMARMMRAKREGAREFFVWGRPDVTRELLYSDDLADGLILLMHYYDGDEPINVGSGVEVPMREIAQSIAAVVDYTGSLVFDADQPSGTPRKVLDISKISKFGWVPKVCLSDGLVRVHQDFTCRAFST